MFVCYPPTMFGLLSQSLNLANRYPAPHSTWQAYSADIPLQLKSLKLQRMSLPMFRSFVSSQDV